MWIIKKDIMMAYVPVIGYTEYSISANRHTVHIAIVEEYSIQPIVEMKSQDKPSFATSIVHAPYSV
jgi:hypothetical protein